MIPGAFRSKLIALSFLIGPAFAPAEAFSQTAEEFLAAGKAASERSAWKEAAAAYARAAELCISAECRQDAENKAGFAYLRARAWALALPHFEHAASMKPENPVILNNLGICNLTLYQAGISGTLALDGALRAFEAASRIDPSFRPENLALVRSLSELAAREEAHPEPDITQLDKADNYSSLKAQGIAAESEANFALARMAYERAEAKASTGSRKSSAANMLGLLELKCRRPADARRHFERATRQNPKSKYAWNNLGVTLLRLYEFGFGDLELIQQAVASLKRTAEIDSAYRPENLERAESMLQELAPAVPSQTLTEESKL